MDKYRVLKAYPKQITNSGRLITLMQGKLVYLKKEAQVLRLVKLGFITPVVEIKKRPAKQAKPEPQNDEIQPSQNDEAKRKAKAEFLSNKKNKGEQSPN